MNRKTLVFHTIQNKSYIFNFYNYYFYKMTDKYKSKIGTVLGLLLAFFSIAYAVYVDEFKVEKPEIIFEIHSKTPVFDLNEQLTDLEISYKGVDVKLTNENLELITIKITNIGEKDITEYDYAKEVPFGLKIMNGKIVERPIVLESSNEFLQEYINVRNDSANNIFFDKIQFDKDQYFTMKVLTISNLSDTICLRPLGKVSGMIENIKIVEENSEDYLEPSFFKRLTNDNLGIHIARFFYYLFCIGVFSFFVGLPISKLVESIDTSKRKKNIRKYKKHQRTPMTGNKETVLNLYNGYGSYCLYWISGLIEDQDKLNSVLQLIEEKGKHLDQDNYRNKYPDNFADIIFILKEKNVLFPIEEKWNFNAQFRTELEEFIYFIEIS